MILCISIKIQMKYLITLLLLFSLVGCVSNQSSNYIPTPAMAMGFNLGADSVEWATVFQDANSDGFIMEFVPQGQNIEAWNEMVAQQITFTDLSLEDHIVNWKNMVLKGDQEVEINVLNSESNSKTLTYISVKFNEYSIRKFMHAPDGIYTLAYHIRVSSYDDKRVQIWKDIIEKARLVPNPLGR